jgi:hypothetical protein
MDAEHLDSLVADCDLICFRLSPSANNFGHIMSDMKDCSESSANGTIRESDGVAEPGSGSKPNVTLNPMPGVSRRWTVIASGLLLLALALVVIYTGRNAFFSPLALVVVAAIGLAALLLQVWFRRELPLQSPMWLNVLGIVCAVFSLFADYLRLTRGVLELVAFGAVVCFGISGSVILQALRRKRRVTLPANSD